MKRATRVGAGVALAGLGLLVAILLRGEARLVETAEVRVGAFEVSFQEEGKTRLRERYRVTAPIAGWLRRIEIEEGDAVQAGQVLAEIQPTVAGLLDPFAMQPLLHVSQRYPASRLCAAVVLPLAAHPAIANRVIVFDLDGNEDDLLQHDAGDIADRLYTPAADLPPGVARVPLKEVHLNRSPMLVPWAHLRAEDFQRLGLDAEALQAKADRLRAHGPALAEKARQVFAGGREYADSDVDGSIYAGFIGEGDKRLCVQVRSTPPAELGTRAFEFRDPRLPELLFRYRARNWPDTLDATGRERWDDYRRQRLAEGSGLSEYGFEGFFAEIQALRATHAGDGARLVLLDQLEQWGHQLQSQL